MTAASHIMQIQSKMLEHMLMETLSMYWHRIYENDVIIISIIIIIIIVIIYHTQMVAFDNAIGIIIEFVVLLISMNANDTVKQRYAAKTTMARGIMAHISKTIRIY